MGFDERGGFIFSTENSTIASGEVNTILFITARAFQWTRSYYYRQQIPWLTPGIIPCLAHWIFSSDYKITSCFAQTRKYSLTLDNFSLVACNWSQIDLFRLYILFSQYRSCDDTQGIWSFVLFIKKNKCKHEYALFNEQDKGSNLLSIITWSVLGKQNVQAKKVY